MRDKLELYLKILNRAIRPAEGPIRPEQSCSYEIARNFYSEVSLGTVTESFALHAPFPRASRRLRAHLLSALPSRESFALFFFKRVGVFFIGLPRCCHPHLTSQPGIWGDLRGLEGELAVPWQFWQQDEVPCPPTGWLVQDERDVRQWANYSELIPFKLLLNGPQNLSPLISPSVPQPQDDAGEQLVASVSQGSSLLQRHSQ